MNTDRERVSYSDLQSWPADGRQYELYEGEVRLVPAPFPRHQIALLELYTQLRAYRESHGGHVLVSPIDIVFDEYNVLQPDIVVFTAAQAHHVHLDAAIRMAPDVAVEVLSPATFAHDRGAKRRMFERFGVREFWIVDPRAERVEVHALSAARYARLTSAERGEAFQSPALPGFLCEVSTLFPW